MTDAAQNERRFAALFNAYHEDIQRYCIRRLPHGDVNDAVAEVFMVAWRRIDKAPSDNQLPWLYGVAKNVIRNAQRSSRRRRNLSAKAERTHVDSVDGPEVQVVQNAESEQVLEALERLSPSDQEVLRLKVWEELSHSDIAAALGTTTRAVDMRLTRARRRLHREFTRMERRTRAPHSPRFAREGGG